MASRGYMLLLSLAVLWKSAYSGQAVPALLWSPERSMSQLPEISGMNEIGTKDFLNSFLNPLMNSPSEESSVVFLQDKLHMDDFTQFADVYSVDSDGGAFQNLKSLMDSHFSLELPQVSDPHVAVKQLKDGFSGDVHTITSLKDMDNLDLTTGKKFLLIVQLTPVTGQKDQENAIKENDATIGAVSKHLQKRGIKYTAMFTGEGAHELMSDSSESFSNRRLLAEASESSGNGTFMNVSDIYIYLKTAFVCLKTKDNTDPFCPTNFTLYPDENSTAINSDKVNNTANIVLEFNGITPSNSNKTKYDIKFVQEAINLYERWTIVRSTLSVTSENAGNNATQFKNANLSKGDMDFVVPILYSYHCSEMVMYVDYLFDKNVSDFKGSYINLTGYQIQPFNTSRTSFANAQDCVGFFTRGIWMGLFTSGLLLLILLFGVLMVLDLSIMDKYDDPKGKTIIVAQASE